LEYPPSSENAATIEALVDVLATGFEMIGFIADLELDHHSHQQPALTALVIAPSSSFYFFSNFNFILYYFSECPLASDHIPVGLCRHSHLCNR